MQPENRIESRLNWKNLRNLLGPIQDGAQTL
jgi:hypothetical protein